MGKANLLVGGQWKKSFEQASLTLQTFRHWIKRDASSSFQPEANRYHLYVSAACPWSHRAMMARELKGLQGVVSMSSVATEKYDESWLFKPSAGREDPLHSGFTHLHQVYTASDPGFTGRVSVPVLWDKKTQSIVSNESADIMRMFDQEFNALAKYPLLNFYPSALASEIDHVNEIVWKVNVGVYRCGLAGNEDDLIEQKAALFEALDQLDKSLEGKNYLVGNVLTETDLRLFATTVRFDQMYHPFFQCDTKKIADYPNLLRHTRAIYQESGIAETVDFQEIFDHYPISFSQLDKSKLPKTNVPGLLKGLLEASLVDLPSIAGVSGTQNGDSLGKAKAVERAENQAASAEDLDNPRLDSAAKL